MAATATINIRIEEDLKEQAQNVLKRNGIGTSEAIRRLFEELAKTQELPVCIQDDSIAHSEEIARKRRALREFARIGHSLPDKPLPDDWDPKEAWHQHLIEKHCFEGIRE